MNPQQNFIPENVRRVGYAVLAGLALLGATRAQDRELGYYPTLDEVDLLGGESRHMYPRGLGGIEMAGPDAGSLTASGIWHQPTEPVPNFYERHDRFFTPLDNTLGLLTPRELAMFESSDEPYASHFSGYADLGFPLTRNFNPDLAMFKAGPLYVDLVTVSATVLYTDLEGRGDFYDDDGWLSAIQLNFRSLMQLTANLYLSASGQVYYLPGDNELGFYFSNGENTFVRLAYETIFRDWEITIFDEFRVHHRLSDILDEVEHDEIDTAGRYRFGRFADNNDTDYFDSDSITFVNRVGATAYKDISDNLALGLGFQHYDLWDTLEFEDHRNWDRAHARLDYIGDDLRFIPFAEYLLTAVDSFEVLYHSYYIGARGPVTENLFARARVGYLHSGGSAEETRRWVGDATLTHNLGPYTTHSLSGGVVQRIWDDGDNWLATYGRYSINQELGPGTWASFFGQYSDLENLDVDGADRNGWSFGAALNHILTEYTRLRFDVSYDEWDTNRVVSRSERQRMVYRATLMQRLAPYLHARMMYQYHDYDESPGANAFDEHLWLLTITHTF